MKIAIFSKTKPKIKKIIMDKLCLVFNFTYAVQVSLESVHQ